MCGLGGGPISVAVILMESDIHLGKSLQSLVVAYAEKKNIKKMKFSLAFLKRTPPNFLSVLLRCSQKCSS